MISSSQRRRLAFTRRCVAVLASSHVPLVLDDLGERIATSVKQQMREVAPRDRVWEGRPHIHGWTQTHLWQWTPTHAPTHWTFLGPELRRAAHHLDAGEVLDAQRVYSPKDPRLAWRLPAPASTAGSGSGRGLVVLDELHPAPWPDALFGPWMMRRLLAGLTTGLAVYGEDFAGIRLLPLRHPDLAVRVIGCLPADLSVQDANRWSSQVLLPERAVALFGENAASLMLLPAADDFAFAGCGLWPLSYPDHQQGVAG